MSTEPEKHGGKPGYLSAESRGEMFEAPDTSRMERNPLGLIQAPDGRLVRPDDALHQAGETQRMDTKAIEEARLQVAVESQGGVQHLVCAACHTRVPMAPHCLNCGHAMSRFCAHCGAHLLARARYCMDCGTRCVS